MRDIPDCPNGQPGDTGFAGILWSRLSYAIVQNEKGPDPKTEAFVIYPGGDLRSHAVTRTVSSARRGLTSVFGMGTGVTLAV